MVRRYLGYPIFELFFSVHTLLIIGLVALMVLCTCQRSTMISDAQERRETVEK